MKGGRLVSGAGDDDDLCFFGFVFFLVREHLLWRWGGNVR